MRNEILNGLIQLSVNQILITHHHEDHSGNIDALKYQFQCPVYGSNLCSELMKKPPKISPIQKVTWGDRPANYDIQPIENRIETSKYSFEIIPIPGHASDMIALYEPKEGWLFSADLWVYDYIRYFMRQESMQEQIESLKRVLKLDFDILFCSHNPQFEGGKKLLEKKLQFFEDFYGEVAKLHRQGLDKQLIMKTMGLKENWQIRLFSLGELSTLNMVKSVIRDEGTKD